MNGTMGDRGEAPANGIWPWFNMYQHYQTGYPGYGHQMYYPYYGHQMQQFHGQQHQQPPQSLLGMPPNGMKDFVPGGTLMPFGQQNNCINNQAQSHQANKKEEEVKKEGEKPAENKTGEQPMEMPPLPPGPPPPMMRFPTPPPPGTSPNRFYQPNLGPIRFSLGKTRQGIGFSNPGSNNNNNNNNSGNNSGMNMNENNNQNTNCMNLNGKKNKKKRNKLNKMMNQMQNQNQVQNENQMQTDMNEMMVPPPPPHVLLKVLPPPLPPGPPPAEQPPLPPPIEEKDTQLKETGLPMNQVRNGLMNNQQRTNSFTSSEDWPAALKSYIERCYSKCVTSMDRDRVDIILKGKIMRANRDETVWSKDWDNEPLPLLASELDNVTLKTSPQPTNNQSPSHVMDCDPPRKAGKGLSQSLESRLGQRRSFSRRSRSPVRKGSPKRRRDRSDSSSSSDDDYKSVKSKSKMGKFNKNNRNGPNKNKGKMNKQMKSHFYSEMGLSDEPINPEILEKRAARFSNSKSEKSNSSFQEYQSPLTCMKKKKGLKLNLDSPISNTFQDISGDFDFSEFHVIGTCQDIEKPYLRLTAAPEPSAVRPPVILHLSLSRVKERWVQNQDYFYACEQLKSIRQDLTVQGIRDELTVQVYETHARIALEKGDHAEFNQCQSQLRTLYCDVSSPNRLEFTAYRILYYIFTKDFMDLSTVLASLSDKDKEDECVSHALKVRSAWWLCNYHRLFKLYKCAPRMASYLIDWFLPRERKLALKAIVKSYRQQLAVEFVSQELAFDSDEQCVEFLAQFGVIFVDPMRTKIDCKASTPVVCVAA